MLKLIGFSAGVAISVLVLLSLSDDATVGELRETGTRLRAHGAALLAGIRTPQAQPAPGSSPPAPPEGNATGPAEPAAPSSDPAPLTERESEEGNAHRAEVKEPGPAPRTLAAAEPPLPGRAWHAVWQPFRSATSAGRFAARLARVTGREYRVQRLSPWAHQVEFVSVDDADRAATLQRIEESTGLRLVDERR